MVFLTAFFLVLLVSLGASWIPPGRVLYGMLGVPETGYPVLGTPATTLVIGAFNGIVYGFVAWLIYSLASGRRKKAQAKAKGVRHEATPELPVNLYACTVRTLAVANAKPQVVHTFLVRHKLRLW